LQVLQEHQAALLALQQKAQEQLKEARAAQVNVVMTRRPVVSAEENMYSGCSGNFF
jgi:hypothetical protein